MPDNTCVCCGRIIPEGRQVCSSCEQKYTGGCTNCVRVIDDFGRCLIAEMFDRRVNPEHGCSWKVPIKRRAIQTNGDRIRAMTDEQLAEFLSGKHCFSWKYMPKQRWLEWVKEVSEDA